MWYLVLKVNMVLKDGTLVGSGPNVVLHHVLLLREIAIELEGDKVKREKAKVIQRPISQNSDVCVCVCPT